MSTETDGVEKTLVNFRIGVKQKEAWEEYIEETGAYTTLTQLILNSVQAEINGSHQPGTGESPALSNDIAQLRDDLQRVKKDVRWLRNQEQDEVDISDVAQDVFDELVVLPQRQGTKAPDEPVDDDLAAAQLVVKPDGPDDNPNPQTKDTISDRLGITEDEFEEAIEHLQDQFLPVVEVELDGEIHYFKEE